MIGLNGNRDGIKRESRDECRIIRRSDIDEGVNIRTINKMTSFETRAGGLSLPRDIRIIRFRAEAAIFTDPIKGIIHKTAITAVIAAAIFEIITIDELLFRERDKLAEFVKENTF